ncbi:hypothetical protein FJ250_00915 [bacterium]|nr:hypothetical protein [bacterium]
MSTRPRLALLFCCLLLAVAPAAASAQADCCVVPDNGNGTATLPPASTSTGCVYAGTTEIVDGLPPGATIQITGWFGNFTAVTEAPGGVFGGTISTWQGQFLMNMSGTGSLLGFNRSIVMPLSPWTEIMEFAPRMLAAPVQAGVARVSQLHSQIAGGDPDFDLLRITAGDNFGLPSPGAYQVASTFGGWGVSGHFDLMARIDFVGRPGSVLGGMSGSTVRVRRFEMCPGGAVETETTSWSGIKALYR